MASLIKRGNVYYAQYMTGKRAKRVSLDTSSLQLAKEKIRQLESALYRGHDNPLPTKTPIATVVTRYIEHMCTHKTARSVQRDISYLREAFGPICPALELKNPKISLKGKKRPPPTPPPTWRQIASSRSPPPTSPTSSPPRCGARRWPPRPPTATGRS